MNKKATKRTVIIAVVAILLITGGYMFFPQSYFTLVSGEADKNRPTLTKLESMDRAEKKAARSEYFFRLMRDPATNQIPENIRNRELQFAKTLPSAGQALQLAKTKNPSLSAADYTWQQAGPLDVGGRTRALAVDQRDPDIILAGGVSGGMWKSTDGGNTWSLTTPDLSNLSVTSITQDPLNPDTWYYTSGEVLANSASANNSAPYYGRGIYKSTNNGNSWSLMPAASSNAQDGVDIFNTVSRIRINPITGTIFIASTGFGIYRSTDGSSFSSGPVLGDEGEQLFADVAVANDGTIGAILSEASFTDQQSRSPSNNHNPGIFISENDGLVWQDVTPEDFPSTYRRSVITFAPSNPDIIYVLTLKGATNTSNQGVAFFKIDISDPLNPVTEDRSANLPDFREDNNDTGYVNLQGGYNMTVSVKPDDENYVFIGGTNLFRSTDGFATAPTGGYDGSSDAQKNQFWVGGYNKNNTPAPYPGHHPDQHIIAFPQPENNPNLMWSGHDGGLSHTSDITATSVSWQNRDNGYITSQFYAADIPDDPNDNRLMGGTQDNGTPYFEFGQSSSQASIDISSGDGGYAFFTSNHLYVSSQNGRVLRYNTDFDFSYVFPADAASQLFIHPYTIDPNDENVMYYPDGSHIWRNTELDVIPNGNSSSGALQGWEELTDISVGAQQVITALETSQVPSDILYLAGFNSNAEPTIKRIQNANSITNSSTNIRDISLPANNLSGSYIKDIAVNPVDGDEVIVVLSNYNITGLYHTTDGGGNWQAIEGNLTGNSSNPGPSLRSATIVPAEGGNVYLLGTSTGLYSTQLLDGNSTTWGQEAGNSLGNAVTDHLSMRLADGDIAAATHGRGIFKGNFGGEVSGANFPIVQLSATEGRAGNELTIEATNFEFSSTPSENEVFFEKDTSSVRADVVTASPSEITVIIPRGVIPPRSTDKIASIRVENDDGTNPQKKAFKILAPFDFTIKQNYPNPFNPTTTIPFDLPASGRVTLTVYNMNGQLVLKPLDQEFYNSGTYNYPVNLSGLASGIYIYRIYVKTPNDDAMQSQKMTFIK